MTPAPARREKEAIMMHYTGAEMERILCAMESQYSGGFVRAFAEAFRRADSENQALLRPVFDKYAPEYLELADSIENRAHGRITNVQAEPPQGTQAPG